VKTVDHVEKIVVVAPRNPIPTPKDSQQMPQAQQAAKPNPKTPRHAEQHGARNAPLAKHPPKRAKWKHVKQKKDGPDAKRKSEPAKSANNKPEKRKNSAAKLKRKHAALHARSDAQKKNKQPVKQKLLLKPKPLKDAIVVASAKKRPRPKPRAAAAPVLKNPWTHTQPKNRRMIVVAAHEQRIPRLDVASQRHRLHRKNNLVNPHTTGQAVSTTATQVGPRKTRSHHGSTRKQMSHQNLHQSCPPSSTCLPTKGTPLLFPRTKRFVAPRAAERNVVPDMAISPTRRLMRFARGKEKLRVV
jgi:hypothetical protein